MELLSVPLHLKLLSEIASDTQSDPLTFATARDLYDHYWEHKQNVVSSRLGRSIQWTHVLDLLCDYMSGRQVLTAPKDVVADYRQDALAMASDHVIVQDGSRYAFFHETFFDYAFARRFVARGGELRSLLLSSEQFLFRRAQVRQILLHERDEDRPKYLADLTFLLSSPDIRFHLKQVIFGLLSQLTAPTLDEWNILSPHLKDTIKISNPEHDLSNEVWQVLGTTPWFRLIDSNGVIQQRLESQNDALVDQTVRYLSLIAREEPDRIAEIAQGWVDRDEKWNERLLYLVQWVNLEASRSLFDLFLHLLNQGTLDQLGMPFVSNNGIMSLYELPKKQPEWACELLSDYFERRLQLSLAQGQNDPFHDDLGTISDQSTNGALLDCATGAPKAFVAKLLPFMFRLMELNAIYDGEPPWKDRIWPFRIYGVGYGLKEELISAMESALRILAKQSPEDFMPYAIQLQDVDYETGQFLLIRAYEANGECFADDAVNYLCERPARLYTGYTDNGYWATQQLLDVATPHCSEDSLRTIEGVVMNYYSWYERSKQSYHKGYGTQFGRAQLTLLNGIAKARRSTPATRRLKEWRRKFSSTR